MSKDVRLLPAVIGVGAILFALKASGVAFNATAAESPAAPSPPAATSLAGDPTAAINAAMPIPRPSQSAQAATPSPTLPPELEGTGVTSAEMDVLSSLADRRSALDERERELALKANLLAAAEQRVNQKIAELKALQAKIQQMLDQRETMEKTQIDSLVKAYSGMKPADAARIFTQLDDKVRLAVASRMKPDAIAGILAKMPPEAAQKLTVQLATRLKVTETPAPAPAASASAAQTVASLTPPPLPAANANAATTLASTAPPSYSPPASMAQPASATPAPAVQAPAAPQVQASIQPPAPTATTTPVIAPMTAPLAAPAPVKPAPAHQAHAPSHPTPHRPAAIHAAAPAAHAPTPLQSQAQPQATPQHTANAQPSAVTATTAAAIIAAPATEPAPAPPVVPAPVAPAPVVPSSPSGPSATAGP